ncbi:MAG: type II secretion system protein [Candidatus Shapirobacteria bacterium]|jgi:type II secretory pathway pseudopilin PulG
MKILNPKTKPTPIPSQHTERKIGIFYHRGFTLIEIIVFTGIMGLMMVGLIGVLLNSLRARNRSRLEDLVDYNGTWVGEQLKWNLLNATFGSVVCDTANKKITLENKKDNITTVLGCRGTKIASESGVIVYDLSGEEVEDSCNMVGESLGLNCTPDVAGNVVEVEVSYKISNKSSGTNWEDRVVKGYTTKVVVRQ